MPIAIHLVQKLRVPCTRDVYCSSISVPSSADNYSEICDLFGQQKLYVTMEMYYYEKNK